MKKLIQIEGSRNCGKTYLISQLDHNIHKIYKLPFINFYNKCYTKHLSTENKMSLNNNKELFYFTVGYDVTILDLLKTNIIDTNIITDRGMLSNLVFGIQSKRITINTAYDVYSWLNEQYKDYMEIVYIKGINNNSDESRNKDTWKIYNKNETDDLYNELIEKLNIPILNINNNFDNQSIINFKFLIDKI
jgi:hypothetical protein